jgi:putative transposase
MPQSFASLHCHVIFSTKNRAPFITGDIQPRLYAYWGGICQEHGNYLVAAGGVPDHVHLLLSLSRDQSIADVVRVLKSNASKWIHETFPASQSFAWQSGHAAFAVSFSHINQVKTYLARQEARHRKQTYQEELVAFLQRHQIEFDERYLWD